MKIEIKPVKLKYICNDCTEEKVEDDFYLAKYSNRWNASNKRALYCKECVDKVLRKNTNKYGEQMAVAICCSMIDIPFYAEVYQSVIQNNPTFGMGMYSRLLNGTQFRGKTFLNSLVEGEFGRTEAEIRESTESKWNKIDKQNVASVIESIGYDTFEGYDMNSNDRKYCFNVLAGYCRDEMIKEDNHMVQSVIEIAQIYLQSKKIDSEINRCLKEVNRDNKRLGELVSAKKSLLDTVSRIVRDNGLASSYSDNVKRTKDTFTELIDEMSKDGYKAIKANLFDIKTAEAMKQIEDLSNRSILEQIALDQNDYTEMIKDQRALIAKFETERDSLQEENRLLKNSIEYYKNGAEGYLSNTISP